MKGKMNTEMGQILIDKDVVSKYVGSAAVECFGVVGMASVNVKDGVAKLLKKDHIKHGVSVALVENKLRISLHIIVAYGVSIVTVANNLMDNVTYKIEEYTGLEIEELRVFVEGVRVTE